MHAVVSGNCTVRGFGFNAAIRRDKHGSHETQRAITLSYNIRLDVSIVVFTSPDVATVRLYGVGNHIVNKAMLVNESLRLKRCLIFALVDFLKYIFEASVVLFQDSVLGAQVERIVAPKCILKAGLCKLGDRRVCVVHAHQHAWLLKFVSFHHNSWLVGILGLEGNQEIPSLFSYMFCRTVLIAKGVTTNDNGLGPAGHQARNVSDNNRLTEHSAV